MDKSLRPVARPRSKTGEMTRANRPVWRDEQTGESYSERTVTVPYGDGFVVMPSVGKDGATYTEEQIYEYVKKNGPVDFMTGEKLPIFEDIETAGKYARARSGSLMDADQPMPEFKSRRPEMMEEEAGTSMMDVGKAVAKLGLAGAQLAGKKLGMDINPTADNPLGFSEGGNVSMQKQMSMFEDGGLLDEGGMVDEVSGNDVPIGSTRKEVRDDIPAKLSEGEFVFPADVVRYYGLEKLMELRQNAKMGLRRMEEMGQMGNSDEATLPDDLPFGMDDLIIIAEPQEFAEGGMPQTTPLPIAPVPTRGPNTSLLSGMTSGMRMVTYVNDEGNTMVIPHVNGVPIYPIPDGYRVLAEGESPTGSDTTPTQDTTTQQPVQTTPREEFDGGPDPADDTSFDWSSATEQELQDMVSLPGRMNTTAISAIGMLAGIPGTGFLAKTIANLNAKQAQKELDKRAEINDKIKTDVEETLKSLQQEQEEAPVKGAPVSDVTQSNIDAPQKSDTNIDDVDLPSSFNFNDDDTVMSQSIPTPSPQEFYAAPPVPDITVTTLGPAPKGLPSMPVGAVMPESATPASLPSGSTNTPPNIGVRMVNTPQTVPSLPTEPTTPSFTPESFPTVQSQMEAISSTVNSTTPSGFNVDSLSMGENFRSDDRTPDYAGTPGYSLQGPQTVSGTGPTSNIGLEIGNKSPTFSLSGVSGQTPSEIGFGYSGLGSSGLSDGRDDMGYSLGQSDLDTSPGSTTSGGTTTGPVGFGDISESGYGMDFSGGPDGDGPGPSGPSGSGQGSTSGGGGSDSGQASGGQGAGAYGGGSSGGDAGTGSDNDNDGFGDMGGISGGWNKGGLVSKKAKPKKRKPNTSRGIAARKK